MCGINNATHTHIYIERNQNVITRENEITQLLFVNARLCEPQSVLVRNYVI